MNKKISPILALAVLTILLSGCGQNSNTDTSSVVAPSKHETASSTTDTTPSEGETMGMKYMNGTYSVTGRYFNPAGEADVDVTVTLENDIIVDTTFVGHGTKGATKKMQDNFTAGFSEEVLGKSIDDVALTIVNGSSLTPEGFMDALEQIKVQAKAS